MQVFDLGSRIIGAEEGPLSSGCVGDRNLEAFDKVFHRLVCELLFLVRRVARLGRAQAVALDGLREDDRRATLIIKSSLVGVVDLVWIVATAMQMRQLLVRLILDELQQLRILPEELLAK